MAGSPGGNGLVLTEVRARAIDCDVAVVGGGTSGVMAAVAAARAGARCVLVEYLPFLGGTHGGGALVMGTIGFSLTGPDSAKVVDDAERVVAGLPLEYYDRMVASGGAFGRSGRPGNAWQKDIELSKTVLDDLCREAGVAVWFASQLVEVLVEGGAVVGLLVARGGSATLLRCAVAIDGTGDGLLGARAGASTFYDATDPHRREAATLYFEIGGVQPQRLLDYLEEHPEDISRFHRARGVTPEYLRRCLDEGLPFVVRMAPAYDAGRLRGCLPSPPGRPDTEPGPATFWMHWRDGRWLTDSFSVNIDTVYGLDPLDRDQHDRALMEARRFVLALVRHYQRHVPGMEAAYLLRFAPLLGVRDGRRIRGRYVLGQEDVVAATDFDDAVGRCGVRVDLHLESDSGREIIFMPVGGDRGWYQVPLRALVCRDVEGLMMAGRCISADHVAHGSMRHQVPCMMTGQAAGVAAAIAVEGGRHPSAVDASAVQQQLRSQGALI